MISILKTSNLNLDSKRVILFFMIFTCYSYFLQAPAGFHNPNEYSRMYLTKAIVDYGTTSIDDVIKKYDITIDRSLYEGHYYSSKAPGLSLLGIPIYFSQKVLERLFGLELSNNSTLYILHLLCLSLPSALFCIFLYNFLKRLHPSKEDHLQLAFGYGLGTIAFTYSTLFFILFFR